MPDNGSGPDLHYHPGHLVFPHSVMGGRHTNWSNIIGKLFIIMVFLAVFNYLLYQQKGSDNEACEIDKWALSSSLAVLIYYVTSFLDAGEIKNGEQ